MVFDAFKCIVISLIISVILLLPQYAWLNGENWWFARGFPLGWLSQGLTYTNTFFHEIGHTLFAWYYGFFTIPMFDFQHGGGFAYHFGGQNMAIVIGVNGLLLYGIYHFRDVLILQILCGLLVLMNIATVMNEPLYMSVIDFMGPGFVPLVSAFFLFRALYDLAPRGAVERYLNAIFGLGMILHNMLFDWALLNNDAYREVYYKQKGSHGFGDFDKIASRYINIGFDDVVWASLSLNAFCLVFCVFGFYDFQTKNA